MSSTMHSGANPSQSRGKQSKHRGYITGPNQKPLGPTPPVPLTAESLQSPDSWYCLPASALDLASLVGISADVRARLAYDMASRHGKLAESAQSIAALYWVEYGNVNALDCYQLALDQRQSCEAAFSADFWAHLESNVALLKGYDSKKIQPALPNSPLELIVRGLCYLSGLADGRLSMDAKVKPVVASTVGAICTQLAGCLEEVAAKTKDDKKPMPRPYLQRVFSAALCLESLRKIAAKAPALFSESAAAAQGFALLLSQFLFLYNKLQRTPAVMKAVYEGAVSKYCTVTRWIWESEQSGQAVLGIGGRIGFIRNKKYQGQSKRYCYLPPRPRKMTTAEQAADAPLPQLPSLKTHALARAASTSSSVDGTPSAATPLSALGSVTAANEPSKQLEACLVGLKEQKPDLPLQGDAEKAVAVADESPASSGRSIVSKMAFGGSSDGASSMHQPMEIFAEEIQQQQEKAAAIARAAASVTAAATASAVVRSPRASPSRKVKCILVSGASVQSSMHQPVLISAEDIQQQRMIAAAMSSENSTAVIAGPPTGGAAVTAAARFVPSTLQEGYIADCSMHQPMFVGAEEEGLGHNGEPKSETAAAVQPASRGNILKRAARGVSRFWKKICRGFQKGCKAVAHFFRPHAA